MTTDATSQPTARRSGSENRQRSVPISVRCLPDERDELEIRARDAGLTVASYLRASGLGTPGPRAKRRPPVNAEALARATAALNKAGSNLNQIAHVLNAGGAIVMARDYLSTLAVVREAAAAIREIVRRKDRI